MKMQTHRDKQCEGAEALRRPTADYSWLRLWDAELFGEKVRQSGQAKGKFVDSMLYGWDFS